MAQDDGYAGDVGPREAWDILAAHASAALVDVRTDAEWTYVGLPDLTRLGKDHVFYSYPGADHAFMDFTNPQRHHKEASEAAWPRTLEFFTSHLKGAAVSR